MGIGKKYLKKNLVVYFSFLQFLLVKIIVFVYKKKIFLLHRLQQQKFNTIKNIKIII